MRSDPVADMLTRLRNGSRARLAKVEIPFSKLKLNIAHVLKAEGFVDDVREVPGRTAGHGVIEVALRYDDRRQPVLNGIKRLSSPGMRNYMRSREIPKVQSGLGVLILTTPKGLMTDREAKKQKLGGEALCAVW